MRRCVLRRLSERDRSEIWDRFEAGESQRSISSRLKRPPSTIRTHLLGWGFRRPLPGPEWSTIRLSLTEREEISRGLAAGESVGLSFCFCHIKGHRVTDGRMTPIAIDPPFAGGARLINGDVVVTHGDWRSLASSSGMLDSYISSMS